MKDYDSKTIASHSTLTLIAILVVPIVIVLAASVYYACQGIKQNLATYAQSYVVRLDEMIFELHRENLGVLKGEQGCGRLEQEQLFESQFRELILAQNQIAICSSRRGQISYDLSSLVENHTGSRTTLLYDINNDPQQRTLIVMNGKSGKTDTHVLAIVDKGYLIDRLGLFSNSKLKAVTVQFGDKVYPVENSMQPDTLYYIQTSKHYGYQLLVQASSEYIKSHTIYTALTSLPFSIFVSVMILLSGKFLKHRDSLADDLKKGIGRGELFLVYQPSFTETRDR
ncbi:CSS-motif domain-containing protein [Vibrio sonorensis]|uniref:CSS-motif domain-containing protein n=1 Tax=Vibrio sonorensis TaxID=1004316 RepID=UPI0008D92479|nr:CSS-motif domain-containing protein [Vibrio sonorensis]